MSKKLVFWHAGKTFKKSADLAKSGSSAYTDTVETDFDESKKTAGN